MDDKEAVDRLGAVEPMDAVKAMDAVDPMDDHSLLAQFEACTLPAARLGHREHVRLAWLYLDGAPFEEAARRFCASLRRFTAALGKADRYHTTITWAFLALVQERRATRPAPDFDAFAAANPDLLDARGALAAHYDRETIESELARRVFLLPRRSALP